jgi:hypothetical protein
LVLAEARRRQRRLTTYKLKRGEAASRFPGAEPDLQSREVRQLPDKGEIYGNSRPPTS